MTIDFEQRKRSVTVDARLSGDAALVEKALLGGPVGFRPVVEKFQSAVSAVALSRIRDFHLARTSPNRFLSKPIRSWIR